MVTIDHIGNYIAPTKTGVKPAIGREPVIGQTV
jgi:hypothetical protein